MSDREKESGKCFADQHQERMVQPMKSQQVELVDHLAADQLVSVLADQLASAAADQLVSVPADQLVSVLADQLVSVPADQLVSAVLK